GSPPCITATSLNVVPKSIPTVFPTVFLLTVFYYRYCPGILFFFFSFFFLCCFRLLCLFCNYRFAVPHGNCAGTKDFIMQAVPFLQFPDDLAVLSADMHHGFMKVRVKHLSHRLNRGYSLSL